MQDREQNILKGFEAQTLQRRKMKMEKVTLSFVCQSVFLNILTFEDSAHAVTRGIERLIIVI